MTAESNRATGLPWTNPETWHEQELDCALRAFAIAVVMIAANMVAKEPRVEVG